MVKTIPPTSTSDSSDTLMPTTDTMRKEAEFVSKCFIYVLKMLRCIKCNKSTRKDKTKQEKNHDNVVPPEGSA